MQNQLPHTRDGQNIVTVNIYSINYYMNSFTDFNITTTDSGFEGDKIKMSKILGKEIIVHAFRLEDSKCFTGKCLYLQIEFSEEMRIVFSSSMKLI